MNQITLYRKGGRKPWVFEKGSCGKYTFKGRAFIYKINFNYAGHGKHYITQERANTWDCYGFTAKTQRDLLNKIHADHFTLGNVTITF